MTEFAPIGGKIRMTKAQLKKYLADMKKAQALAKAKLEEAKKNGEFKKEAQELADIEKKLEDYFE